MKNYYVLHTPKENIFFDADIFEKDNGNFRFGEYTLTFSARDAGICRLVELSVFSDAENEVYLSVCTEGMEKAYSFNGKCLEERIFRQSPHDCNNYNFKMQMSAIPMIAAVSEDCTDILISDNPSFFDNATTQHIIPEEQRAFLSSGDPGGAPNYERSDNFEAIYHKIDKNTPHVFRFIAFRSGDRDLKSIRRSAYRAIESVWGSGSDSLYRATCFAVNYMHIRKNESGSSEKWIVPGIQYANCQYVRDSFYQTLIMDADTEEQCYDAFNKESIEEAENPLIYLIWSYRLKAKGKHFNKHFADIAFETVIKNMDKFGGGGFYPNCRENGDFRNWFDICSYEFDDVDAYSQGLCICALECARRLGYDIGDRREAAKARYRTLFNGEYIPMSEKKQFLAVDISVGEVLNYMLFGEKFIDDMAFEKTYRKICDGPSRTPHGIKIVSAPDGSYLPKEAYGLNGFVHPGFDQLDTGRYANGGSYHVYEMLFHIAAYIHGISDAEENLTGRLMIDLDFDGATHEYMHTVKGNGVKANQGWNAAIYAVWDALVKRGEATDGFFRAADRKIKDM